MQKLSRVRPKAITNFGIGALAKRPAIAAKVAECIATWSEIELLLGQFLAFLLHADEAAALAMYSSIENRSSQLKMIEAAISANLTPESKDAFMVLINSSVRSQMKCRDKFAHWVWGYSDDLPDARLISDPNDNRSNLSRALRSNSTKVTVDANLIFVIRESDLVRSLQGFYELHNNLVIAMASVWELNSTEERAAKFRQLSTLDQIRTGVTRIRNSRQKTLEAHSQSPQLTDGDGI